jgi:hypothetical protein
MLRLPRVFFKFAVLLMLVGVPSYSHARGFLPAVSYPTGDSPYSVAIGDFNGDGKPDLAAVNNFDATISILRGMGDGSFQSGRTLRACDNAQAISAADLNGDGRVDLAVVCPGVHHAGVVVLLNSATGFLPRQSYASGSQGPNSLVVVDFDGDGILDLAVGEGGSVAFLKGNGDGSFQSPELYDANGPINSVAAGDLDGDGNLDLAVADGTGGVDILLGNGDGSFRPAMPVFVGTAVRSVAVGDFDQDGNLDLVTANCSTEGCSISNRTDNIATVLMGNGDGTFQPPVAYTVGLTPRSVVVADFNGDGVLDVAVAVSLGRVTVMLGHGDGTFPVLDHFSAGNAPWFVAAGDFNRDRAIDLAVVDEGGNDVSILMNVRGTFVTTNSSQNPAPVGQPVTFTATVAPSLVSTTPTGKITFADSATILATVPLNASGQASFTTSGLSLGTHTIRTKYSGDPNFNPNTGKAITQIIQ